MFFMFKYTQSTGSGISDCSTLFTDLIGPPNRRRFGVSGHRGTACHHSSRRVSELSSQSIQKRFLWRFEPGERWPLMRLGHSEYSGVCAIVSNPWPIGLSRPAFGRSVSTYTHPFLIAASPSISHSLAARKRVWQELHIIRAWPPAIILGCRRWTVLE